MAEENVPQVDEKCCSDGAKQLEITEETSRPLLDEGIQGDDVLLPPPAAVSNGNVNLKRYSTGGPGKAHVQTRYRGNNLSSTHDLCKHGKRREDEVVIKPWKLVKKKNAEVGGDLVKVETLSVMKKSLGNVTKPVAKRDAAAANGDIVKSCDGLRVNRSEAKASTTTTASDSAVASKVKKTNVDVKKASRISENKSSKELLLTKIVEPVRCDDVLEKRVSRIRSSKEDPVKSLKNKEKTKIIDEPVGCDDVLEKTLYVVESSVEEEKKKKKMMKKSEIQKSSEKRILRGSGKKILEPLPSLLSPSSEEPQVTKSGPRPIKKATSTSTSKTGLSEKKEIRSATLVTNSKTESKIRPTRIGLKVTPPPAGPPTRPLSFKKGRVLEPKPEDSTPASIKFKKRVVQEPKLRIDVSKRKKSLKDKREGVGKMSITNGEGKREKVVLRHRKVEVKKKLQTLFNNVIEETVNKLEEVRKSSKVKALVGAFETVISLQDDNTKTSQKKKFQSKTTSPQAVEG